MPNPTQLNQNHTFVPPPGSDLLLRKEEPALADQPDQLDERTGNQVYRFKDLKLDGAEEGS